MQFVLQQALARAPIDAAAFGNQLDAVAADDVLGGLDAARLGSRHEAGEVVLIDGEFLAH
ncbi:MAG: hypothetical protein IIA03_14870 [Proteobacteria bacterium]|nr:hypothetical protein [Pseudomonadota bacterium]